MKINRKVISGSSILTILGVVCFATVMVAAAIMFSSAIWMNTVPSGAGAVAQSAAPTGTYLPDNPALNEPYTFRLTVTSNIDAATGSVVIEIARAAIIDTDVVLIYDENKDGSFDDAPLTSAPSEGTLTYTIGADALNWKAGDEYNYDFQITYKAAGTYNVDAHATA